MSKGLDTLQIIRNIYHREYGEDISMDKDFDVIERELKEYEEMKAIKGTTTFDKAIEDTLINACPNVAKKLKALEIIKEKRVDVDLLLMTDNVEDYNKYCSKYINAETQLTQEEYYLLKEVLS